MAYTQNCAVGSYPPVVCFGLSGWIVKRLYPYVPHSFPVLNLLIAAVGT